MLEQLPPEIKADILSRCPTESLLCFRAVSKSWRSLIDNPNFIKNQLQKSFKTHSNLNLIFADSNPNFLYMVSFDSLNTVVELNNPLNHPSYADSNITWAHGFSVHENMRSVGSCNGLVCFINAYERVYLLNPSTRKHKALPIMPSLKHGEYLAFTFGFGYDSNCDDYKVVRLGQSCNFRDSYFNSETAVYDLKVNAWREVQGMPYMLGIDMGGIGVQACETLHWLVVKNRNRIPIHSVPEMIVGFNLQTEEYSGITLPGEVVESGFDFIKLKVVGEWLSVVSIYEGVRFDVWIMKEYGAEKSWTKLFSVKLDKLSSLRCMRKFVFSEDGNELLLEMLPGNLVWYNLREKCIKKMEIHGVVNPIVGEVFHGSLVPLGVGEETDVKKENKESDAKKEPEERKNRRKRDNFLSKGFRLVL